MKRKLLLLLSSALVFSILAGCGGEKEAPVGAINPPEPTQSSCQVQEQVTIHLFHQKQEAQETFAKIIEEFNKEYPYITVEQEIVTNDPAAILKARIATDEIPALLQTLMDILGRCR